MSDITGHTPGPWTVDHERIGPWGEPVALLCDSHAPESGTIVEWPRFGEVVDDEENEANARLIAASPDLLEALETIVRTLGVCGIGLCNDNCIDHCYDRAILHGHQGHIAGAYAQCVAEQAIAKAKEGVTHA